MKDGKTVSKKLLARLAMTSRTSADTSCENKKEGSQKLPPSTASCSESKRKNNFGRPIEAGRMNFDQEGNNV